jgi:drug/metabolite transporter (DMT)-like permease
VTDYILVAVLFAAFLHAFWNALISHAPNKPLYTLSLHLCSAVLAVPVLLIIGLPALASAPYLFVSILLHGGYIFLLSKVYATGSFATAYILMRGSAPIFVTLITIWYLDTGMGVWAVLGIGVLVMGMFSLLYTHDEAPISCLHSSQVKFALLNGLMIAAYTVVDGLGARASQNPVAYVFTSALFEPILVLLLGFRGQSSQIKTFVLNNYWVILLGSIVSLAGYSIVLWAMTLSPIAIISGLRETSVVFAALIALYWFKEGRLLPVLASSGLVFLGILLMKV